MTGRVAEPQSAWDRGASRHGRDAILEAVVAVVDAGQTVRWERAERDLDAEGRQTLLALRVLSEIGARGRRAGRAIESGGVTDPGSPAPETPPPPADPPVSDRYRSREPSSPEEIKRKLYFGAALVLALCSVYSGLFGWRLMQYLLAGLAVLTVLVALVTGAARPPGDPGKGSGWPGASA